jgi:hypothetical protein
MICKDLSVLSTGSVDNFVGNHLPRTRKRLLRFAFLPIARFRSNGRLFNEINNLASNHGKRHAAVQRLFTQ